jgi:hypothetical protein
MTRNRIVLIRVSNSVLTQEQGVVTADLNGVTERPLPSGGLVVLMELRVPSAWEFRVSRAPEPCWGVSDLSQ